MLELISSAVHESVMLTPSDEGESTDLSNVSGKHFFSKAKLLHDVQRGFFFYKSGYMNRYSVMSLDASLMLLPAVDIKL